MLEDVQALVLEVMFQGTLARSCRRRFYNVDDYRHVPAVVFHYELAPSPEMARPAVVCKAWNKAHTDWMQAAVAEEVPDFFRAAVTGGWEMCDLNNYTPHAVHMLRALTRQKHTLWLGDAYVLGVRLSRMRWRSRDRESHRFIAQFHAADVDDAPSDSKWDRVEPCRVESIPPVCWLDPFQYTEDEDQQKLDWFTHQTNALVLWLEQEHATTRSNI